MRDILYGNVIVDGEEKEESEESKLQKRNEIDWFFNSFAVSRNRAVTPQIMFVSTSSASANDDILKTIRLKVEDKTEGAVDFSNLELDAFRTSSPLDLFLKFSSILFEYLMGEAELSDSGNSVDILLEIVVEFKRDMRDDGDVFEYEDDEFGVVTDDRIKTNVNEYSVGGCVVSTFQNYHYIEFKRLINAIKIKITNSYNVEGSDWVLKRVVNLNASLVYNFNEIESLASISF